MTQKFKFTPDSIEKLPLTTTGRVIYWDAKCPGLGLSVGKTKKSYILQGVIKGGREVRLTLGVHGQKGEYGTWEPDTARRRAYELLADFTAGLDPRKPKSAEPAPPSPLDVTWRQGLEWHAKRLRVQKKAAPATIANYLPGGEVARRLGPEWLDRPITSMLGSDLTDLYTRILEETPARAGSVNQPGETSGKRFVAQISAVWHTAKRVLNGHLPGWSPSKGAETNPLLPKLQRIPHDGFPAWLQAVLGLSSNKRDLNLLILATGLRSSSATHLRFSDVDHKHSIFKIRVAKGGKPFKLPLTKTLLAILESRERCNKAEFPQGYEDLIFPTVGRDGKVKPLKHPKIKSQHPVLLSLSALRTTFNSVAEEIGISREHRETLMNHAKNASVNERHYVARESMENLIVISNRIEQALLKRLGVERLDELLGLAPADVEVPSEDEQLTALLDRLGGGPGLASKLSDGERSALLALTERLTTAAA